MDVDGWTVMLEALNRVFRDVLTVVEIDSFENTSVTKMEKSGVGDRRAVVEFKDLDVILVISHEISDGLVGDELTVGKAQFGKIWAVS